SFETTDSITSVARTAFERVLELQKELEEVTARLEGVQDQRLLTRYSDLLHELEALNGYEITHRTEAILEGLGFSTSDLARPYNEFSGGWRMRVLLARMILQQPDLLMLDEPTNHLDLPSIEWLERYLVHYQGTVIIVSHDRYFLDRMVNRTVELYQFQLHSYNGNYSFFETQKAERRLLQQRAYGNQQDYIRQQERFIERFRAKATKAAQAQSALKRLDKLERVAEVDNAAAKIRISFSVDKTPGKVLCTLKEVSKHFGSLTVLDQASAEINRGDKIGLIGANGKGKSTLLRIIAGTEPFEGTRVGGHQVVSSFYAQHQLESLHPDNTILEELQGCGSGKSELELRSLLGCFLFSGDDVFKKIRLLSGGEKARVALAKTIISRANFLLLDEPTNHLDINSVEMLLDALHQYQGSYILVSHDRYFVQQTANKIWEIVDGKIVEFSGKFAEWEQWKASREQQQGTREAPGPKPASATEPEPASEKPRQTRENRDARRELQRQQKKFKDLEARIGELQQNKDQLESSLGSPEIYADRPRFLEFESRYKDAVDRLEALTRQYEAVFQRLLEMESGMDAE
ncbi:MAG TPA: ABC-F family ATP-binding cassette domain-containing protein, partial [Chitinophagaceae bacterium]|nr:ABC-F family ATP-binding cassette domain-containing protein [Chitinophagaceae bacterium]